MTNECSVLGGNLTNNNVKRFRNKLELEKMSFFHLCEDGLAWSFTTGYTVQAKEFKVLYTQNQSRFQDGGGILS